MPSKPDDAPYTGGVTLHEKLKAMQDDGQTYSLHEQAQQHLKAMGKGEELLPNTPTRRIRRDLAANFIQYSYDTRVSNAESPPVLMMAGQDQLTIITT